MASAQCSNNRATIIESTYVDRKAPNSTCDMIYSVFFFFLQEEQLANAIADLYRNQLCDSVLNNWDMQTSLKCPPIYVRSASWSVDSSCFLQFFFALCVSLDRGGARTMDDVCWLRFLGKKFQSLMRVGSNSMLTSLTLCVNCERKNCHYCEFSNLAQGTNEHRKKLM